MPHATLTIFIAIAGALFALAIIPVLKKSRARVRSLRLQILAERSAMQNTRLGQLLVAENTKLIGKGIDQGTLFISAGHRTVSNLTYGLLELFPATRGKSREIREKHMQISEGITHALRAVNKHVGDRIADGIEKATPRKKPAKRRTGFVARRKARRKRL